MELDVIRVRYLPPKASSSPIHIVDVLRSLGISSRNRMLQGAFDTRIFRQHLLVFLRHVPPFSAGLPAPKT